MPKNMLVQNPSEPLSGARTEKVTIRIQDLIGSGDKISLFTLPFLIVGLILNGLFPSWFSLRGPSLGVKVISILVLIPGLILWLWSVGLILTEVPRHKLITNGPYALVKHPIYTSVALMVLPWVGFLLNSWLGALVGLALYIGSRRYSPAEEERLSQTFGPAWEEYRRKVKFPWL